MLGIGALLYCGLMAGDWRMAFNIAAAVMIVTCPCGLGVAVPAMQITASARLFRRRVLLKDGTALEKLPRVDTVVLDKTGTLTTGKTVLANPEALPLSVLDLAAGPARGSQHPLGSGHTAAAATRNVEPAIVCGVPEVAGFALRGQIRGEEARLGRVEWSGASGRRRGLEDDVTLTWRG